MRKLLATTLTTILAISMVACGSKDNTTTETNETAISTESEMSSETGVLADVDIPAEWPLIEVVENPLGQTILAEFKNQLETNPEATAEELASVLINHEAISFEGVVTSVEPGPLAGFDVDITGFEKASSFAPMIGTIPFVGYVFTLAEDSDTEAFMTLLKENANQRWNVCTAADQTVVEAVDNKVFFLMCPIALEE